MNRAKAAAGILIVSLAALAGCQRAQSPASGAALIVATENFLADMTRQVEGDRFSVRSLIPAGVEPHGYEPTPQDIAAVAGARLLVVNGAGLESFQARLLANAGGTRLVGEASRGLVSRAAREGETVEGAGGASGAPAEPDPHFWLDPVLAVTYVQNIRDAVVSLDPRNAALYRANAAAYIAKLRELDAWIARELAPIPAVDRRLVTNHESLGYFADRYGFRIVGTIIPSISSDAEPSARQLARLVDRLRSADVSAVFLETGSNPKLARQVAEEAGIKVVTELYTHALSGADGPAATYIEMMEEDARIIASALRGSR
jgi:ABC-type Zn uptake system ZnuABC Zn-binding protein ZnuA